MTDMSQPLGRMIGNALEVNESIATLQGNGPPDLMEITIALGAAALLKAAGRTTDVIGRPSSPLTDVLKNGAAWEKFVAMTEAQGGDLSRAADGSAPG